MSYFYIASPYTHPNPEIQQIRYENARRFTSFILSKGVYAYSPIVHSHFLDEKPWDFWMDLARAMLAPAEGLIILQIPGWEESVGVSMEIDMTNAFGKPIFHSKVQWPEYKHDGL